MTKILRFLAVLSSLTFLIPASAQTVSGSEKTKDNFMVVVRESIGANRSSDSFTPTGKFKAKLANGTEIELEVASWEFIGDTHIRFVFDEPQSMINATPQDLEQLGIKGPEEALALAMRNVKRVYGEPSVSSWSGGVMQVEGRSPDLNSSYFLDREFWNGVHKSHPDGIVVAIPSRGGLLYAPLSDAKSVEGLKRSIAQLHATSQRLRVSSALFFFKHGKWSVFQEPSKQY